jgi:hypothetical protein
VISVSSQVWKGRHLLCGWKCDRIWQQSVAYYLLAKRVAKFRFGSVSPVFSILRSKRPEWRIETEFCDPLRRPIVSKRLLSYLHSHRRRSSFPNMGGRENFTFCRLVRLSRLRWRHSTRTPHGNFSLRLHLLKTVFRVLNRRHLIEGLSLSVVTKTTHLLCRKSLSTLLWE